MLCIVTLLLTRNTWLLSHILIFIMFQAHSLKMNSSFHAFQLSDMPDLSPNRKHIRLKKSMSLPDDTLEYWGFYLLSGSTVVLSVCSRFGFCLCQTSLQLYSISGLLNLLCGAGNFGKIRSACRQLVIQYAGWIIKCTCNCVHNCICVFVCASLNDKNILKITEHIYEKCSS